MDWGGWEAWWLGIHVHEFCLTMVVAYRKLNSLEMRQCGRHGKQYVENIEVRRVVLVDFDFDSGLHDVMQVSRREYESCSADHPFKIFKDGPASVTLVEEGVFYFICSVANYCSLGQKLSVAVVHHEENSPNSAPISSPRPAPTPNSVS
ncbi:hypothetical protein ACH5RR_016524 [Cinchona calisaya]|uniref:Phytocyanin domain-containing protein n=1 Tax=Cinchona calisaya TaxID=153742 RepID=A0ABD2ZZC4_9GENT